MEEAKENRMIHLNYLIIGSDPLQIQLGSLTFRPAERPKLVFQIKGYINRNIGPSLLSHSVYKVDLTPEEATDLKEAGINPMLDEPLKDLDSISQHWPQGFNSDSIDVVLRKPTATATLASSCSGQIPSAPSTEVVDNKAAQQKVIQGLAGWSASNLSSTTNFKKHQGKPQLQIHNGRPEGATGLPIGLFHPIFDSFLRRIDSATFEPSPGQLEYTLRLTVASQHIYDKAHGPGGRTEALLPILDSLLASYVNNSGASGTQSGGTVVTTNGGCCMILEIKNEIGTGGSDPSIQGAVIYEQHWAQDRLRWLRQQSCCPAFILAISGPWACVLGAVMLKHPVIQPLTPFFSLANKLPSGSSLDNIAKTFASLALSLSDLRTFYQDFNATGSSPDRLRFYPYVRHFTHNGKRVGIKYLSDIPDKMVFRAIAQPEEGDHYGIIVKFAEAYHATAHRLLAAKGLAPELLFVSSEGPEGTTIGNRTMVVMKRAMGSDLNRMLSPPQCVLDDVTKALETLHGENLVFGDLRPPNILAVENELGDIIGGMLIDFDWCGTAGQAKYPYNINLEVQWPEGVRPGAVISKAHDLAMRKRFP